jgi:hypothetical protein
MTHNYVKENNLQTAMAEYQDNMGEGRTLYDQYERELGTVTQVYDNTGHVTLPPGIKELEALTGNITGRTMESLSGAGEQVYAVVKILMKKMRTYRK